MNLHQSIKTVRTLKLFKGNYKYKIVIKSPVAHWFRHNKLEFVKNQLKVLKTVGKLPYGEEDRLKRAIDQKYTQDLYNNLTRLKNFKLRVQSPYLSLYTNSEKDIEVLAKIDVKNVKYVSLPQKGHTLLESNNIVLRRLDYAFRINLKATRQEFNNFLAWAEDNNKIRLTKRSIKDLSGGFSFGGAYFYVKDEKTLSMVRLFLGNCIRSIETVTKL